MDTVHITSTRLTELAFVIIPTFSVIDDGKHEMNETTADSTNRSQQKLK